MLGGDRSEAVNINLKQRIDDVFEVLGDPASRVELRSPEEPYMHRATWPCGCVLDYVHGSGGAYDWDACNEHRRVHVMPTRPLVQADQPIA
jgi:hypothetical protein